MKSVNNSPVKWEGAELDGRPKLSENEVEAAVIRWMTERGWQARRQHRGSFVSEHGSARIRIGVPGQCDWLFIRPARWDDADPGPVPCAVCEIETKAEGVTLSASRKSDRLQLEYIAKRNWQGIPAVWVNSVEMLAEWYERQGF